MSFRLIEVSRNHHDYDECLICGNDEYDNGLCRSCDWEQSWLVLAYSCLERGADLINMDEYSDEYFDKKNVKTKPQALFAMYKLMNMHDRNEFKKLLNNIGG